MNVAQKSILLVEAEPVLAEVTAFRLELLGYQVTVVPTAEEALTRIAHSPPDLVITDLTLPGLDGMALTERLASDQETSDIPVMVLSVDADLDRVQSVYRVGGKDFLVVPYHPGVLEEKVARHVAESRPAKGTAAKPTAVAG